MFASAGVTESFSTVRVTQCPVEFSPTFNFDSTKYILFPTATRNASTSDVVTFSRNSRQVRDFVALRIVKVTESASTT